MIFHIVSSRPPVAWYAIARQYGVYYTGDEVAALSFDQKSNWLKRNPVTAVRHFHYRLNVYFPKRFWSQLPNPLGEISEHAFRTECLARGSPHVHCGIWVKDAAEFDVYVKSQQKRAILKDLVLLFLKQKYSSHCRRNKTVDSDFLSLPVPKHSLQKMILSVATITKDWLCLVKYKSWWLTEHKFEPCWIITSVYSSMSLMNVS